MESLNDKVVVITGASKGLGKSIALKLGTEGAKVALIGRSESDLKEVESQIPGSKYFICDIQDNSQIESTIANIVSYFGNIDIMINNAGVWFEGPTTSHTSEKIQELFQINTIGLVNFSKGVLSIFEKNKSGQLLNIASVAGVEPSADWGVYTATKHAVRGFTDSLRQEYDGKGIKVMGFYPGGMDTELFKTSGFGKEKEPWMMNKDEVADIIVFMLKQPRDINMGHVEARKSF